jgi:hypothetical protein
MPFGKYKGHLIEDVLADDPEYLEWLASQPDFPERYPRLYQLICENDLGPEDAPEPEASRDDDYDSWLRANPAPDLQELVARHGGYDKIPPEAWAEYDRAMAEWQERRGSRSVQVADADPERLCICGRPGVHMRPRKGGGRPIWRCEEHRDRWPDYTDDVPREASR